MAIDLSKDYEAVFGTSKGNIRVQLFDDSSPIAVNNFIGLAKDGFYDGIAIYQVMHGFVAQAGDPLGTGIGGPGYQFVDEVTNGLELDRRGLLAMGNDGIESCRLENR